MRQAIELDGEIIAVEDARFQFDMPVTVSTSNNLFRASLVNLSRSGLRMETVEPLPCDTLIKVKFAGFGPLKARTVWAANGAIGVQFEVPLRLETLSRLVKQSIGVDRLDGQIYI